MSDDTVTTPSHLDVKLFSDFVAGLAGARTLMDTTRPDAIINERPSPNIPEININDGMEYRNVAGYSGRVNDGDFVRDFGLQWNDQTLAGLPGDAPAKFKGVVAYSDFVVTGERDLAIVVPASLAPAAEKVFALTGLRHDKDRGPWDDDTYSRETATVTEQKEGSAFAPGEYVKFNFSPVAIDRFKSRFTIGASREEEVA